MTLILRRTRRLVVISAAAILSYASTLSAQVRVGTDSATRLTRLSRDMTYGAGEGLAYAAIDQWNLNPPEWGKGWRGYGKRVASNVGEFVIQEGVTQGIAALMDRPLDYKRCTCREFGDRFARAVKAAITDQMADGSSPLAVPRIVGAYTGSIAQASWRPPGTSSRARTALINGTTSLGIGALINLFYEFR